MVLFPTTVSLFVRILVIVRGIALTIKVTMHTLVLAISPVLLLRPCIALTFSGVCTFTLLKSEEAIPPTLTMQVVNGVNFS